MAKQISLTFKDTSRERELYGWLKSKVSHGAFIKENLFIIMDNEKKGVQNIKSQQVAPENDNKKQRGINTLGSF